MHPATNPLRRARIQRGLSLSHVAARTLLSPRIVDQLDEGRFSELPGGVYARSHVRAYAAAVGLDPEETVAELQPFLPAAEDPLPTLLTLARVGDPPWLVELEDRWASLRRCITSLPAAEWGGWLSSHLPAVCRDTAVLVGLLAVLLIGAAGMGGTDLNSLLHAGGASIAVLWGTLCAVYLSVAPFRRRHSHLVVRITRVKLPPFDGLLRALYPAVVTSPSTGSDTFGRSGHA